MEKISALTLPQQSVASGEMQRPESGSSWSPSFAIAERGKRGRQAVTELEDLITERGKTRRG